MQFIDRALASFFASWAVTFQQGLQQFQSRFRVSHPNAVAFAAASADEQVTFLKSVDTSPFFEQMRTLTILGMLASPKYGGNYGSLGWKLIGFDHAPAHTPPKPDGVETTDAGWFEPRAALEANAAGEMALAFPTVKQLESLLPHRTADEAIAAHRGREVEPILPKVIGTQEDHRVVLPGDPDYPS